MKDMVKGRDFCLDLCGITDILSKLMEMMAKAQSLRPVPLVCHEMVVKGEGQG